MFGNSKERFAEGTACGTGCHHQGQESSRVALKPSRETIAKIENPSLKEIRFVLFTPGEYEFYLDVAKSMFQN